MERCFRFRCDLGDRLARGRPVLVLLKYPSSSAREDEGDRDCDLLVDIVETELAESRDRDRDVCRGLRDRPLSASP